MGMDRRKFLSLAAAAAAAGPAGAVGTAAGTPFRAIAFDAFPIFDPRPVAALAAALFPGAGAELMSAWRSRQFEYQWLRALGGRYVDFRQATQDGLDYAARQTGLRLTPQQRDRLLGAYSSLPVWQDVPAALQRLRRAGIRLGFLSNMTGEMLEAGLARAGLSEAFEHVLSTDRLRTYKPAPAAYRMAVDAFALPAAQIVFAPFAGWDAAGAKWFGYPTFWVNRAGSPAEELGVAPDGEGRDLEALVAFVAPSG